MGRSNGRAAVLAEANPEVLHTLDQIRRMLEAQDARLTRVLRVEHGPVILRRLTELERLVRGEAQDIGRAPRYTRRRPPLGVS
jgi:hypothetical protein